MIRNKNNMLITGVSGLLGSNLAYYFKDKCEILGLYNSHPFLLEGISTEKCDITNSDNIKRAISDFSPNVIIHCASLTNVDECEADKGFTKLVNVSATKNIVEAVSGKHTKLIVLQKVKKLFRLNHSPQFSALVTDFNFYSKKREILITPSANE